MSINIALIQYPRALASSISFPIDIFNGAAASYQVRSKSKKKLHCHIISIDEVTKLDADNQQTNYRLIILPAIWRNPKPVIKQAQHLIPWLKQQHRSGAYLCGVGTASCLLAESGLLDGQAATTHWFYFDSFAKDYPKVKLQRQHLITQSNRIFCVASINALADLCVYFSEVFFNKEISKQIESHFSPEIRRPAQEQLFKDDQFNSVADELVSQVLYWLRENYMHKVELADLAAQFDTSIRTLNRRFKKAINKTPTQYLLFYRLEVAKSLLRDSNLSVAEIAALTAFSDSSHFIRVFKQDMQATPAVFRQRTRGKLFK